MILNISGGKNMPSEEDIITKIKSNLTGNNDADKAYLIKQFKKYKSPDLINEIGKLMWDLLSDEERKAYKQACINDISIDDFLKSIYKYLSYGDFNLALEELEDIIEILPFRFDENPQYDYFYFNNPLEEQIFNRYFKTTKPLRIIPFEEEYPRIFYLYGIVLMNLSKFNQSENAFKKALTYNPVSGEILSALCILYDTVHDLNNLKKTSIEILRFSYDPLELASAYRNLGYCYYENKKCNISKALYETSLNYENHPRAQIELQLINDYINNGKIDAEQILSDESIPIGVNGDILDMLLSLGLDFEKQNLLNQALYFYGVLYNLTFDSEILNKINDLKSNCEFSDL